MNGETEANHMNVQPR